VISNIIDIIPAISDHHAIIFHRVQEKLLNIPAQNAKRNLENSRLLITCGRLYTDRQSNHYPN